MGLDDLKVSRIRGRATISSYGSYLLVDVILKTP